MLNIHIGCHKTGTTYLQEKVFPKMTDIVYLRTHDSIRHLSELRKCDNYLISFEGLSGRIWDRNLKLDFNSEHSYIKSFYNAVSNLNKIFPEAHIIIFFRKHGDFLVSLYKQYILRGGVLPFDKFFHKDGVIKPEDLYYAERINFLMEKFPNSISIYNYEDLKSDHDNLINSLVLRCNASLDLELISYTNKVNLGLDGWKLEFTRKYNMIFKRMPIVFRKLLFRLKIDPQRLMQTTLSFLKTDKNKVYGEIKAEINNEYIEDWKYTKGFFTKL